MVICFLAQRKKICYHTKWTVIQEPPEVLYVPDVLKMLLETMADHLKHETTPEEYKTAVRHIDTLQKEFNS